MRSFAFGLVAVTIGFGGPAAAVASDRSGVMAFRDGRFAEAATEWMQAVSQGDGAAARHMGVLYDTGEGVQQDRARALSWYRRGAELGDVASMFNVAVCYDSGTGVARNATAAAHWYARAAARHFGRAEYNLALMSLDGDGVRRDPARAARLFGDARRDGIAAAASHTGSVPVVTVAPLLPPDGDALFASAQRALLSRTPSQAAEAVSLFQQAADQEGRAGLMARYDLAWCYEHGVGVPQDRGRAYLLYLTVAARTDDPGLRELAAAGAIADRPAEPVTAPTASLSASPLAGAGTPAAPRGGRSD